MYCAKCNLHTKEYSDKCPLCGGRLRADEEVRKRTAQSEGKALEWTRELILSKAKEILGETELQEVLHPEASQEEEKVPPPPEKEVPLEQEKQPYQRGPALKGKTSGGKKIPLRIGGGILIILVLAVLAYFFLLPSEEPSIPARKKAAATKRQLSQTKPLVSPKKPAAREQKEITEPTVQKPGEETAAPQPDKAPPALGDADVQAVSSTAADSAGSPALSVRPEGKYSIHVGSFKVKENAFDLRDRLQKKGYPVRCFLLPIVGKGEWYRVEVGYYSILEEAQQAASKLKAEEKITALSLIGP